MIRAKPKRISMLMTDSELEVLERSKLYASKLGVTHPILLSLVMDCYLNNTILPVSTLVVDMPKDTVKSAKTTRKYFQLSGTAAETARRFISEAISKRIRPGRLLAILLSAVGDNLSHARLTLSFDGATSTIGEEDVDQ